MSVQQYFRAAMQVGAVAFLVSGLGAASIAHAAKPGHHVDNFTLLDTDGKPHELYKLADKKAVVIMTQFNGCPIARLAMPGLRAIRDEYKARGVEVLLLNPSTQDTPEAVAFESKDFQFGIPVLMDGKQVVGEQLQVNRTGEIFVIDPKTWTVMYHGPIDDRLSYEAQRPATHHYLTDALDAVIAGKKVAKASVNAPGCIINFPNRKATL